MPEVDVERVTFGAVLRVVEFRALWVAEAQSMAGDQLARVALSVMVFDRTGSPSLTALVYALTFLPAIVGGALLSGLADRIPRRSLMIACDLIRAVLVGGMALPGTPLPVVCCLLVVTVLAGRPFTAAQVALLPDILAGESYVVGTGLRMITDQCAQLAGFAGGGIAIAVIGAQGGLAADAVTFAVSALIIRLFVRRRPKSVQTGTAAVRGLGTVWLQMRAATAIVLTSPRLRALVGLGLLAGLHVVPEGVAAPYAADLGGGPVAIGLLMAALPAGTALGAVLIVRFTVRRRLRLIGPLALAAALPMIACAARPDLPVSIVLWFLTGMCSAYQLQAAASFVRAVPDAHRGQTVGLVGSALIATQGLGIVIFGVAAQHFSAASAIALAGGLALALAALLARSWALEYGSGTSEISSDPTKAAAHLS
ncbi:MAG: MFS transporter [Pseudonocardiales bacterium]|nr:MAG: MFS transporter [Pseudonocardiales bacterium]